MSVLILVLTMFHSGLLLDKAVNLFQFDCEIMLE